MPVTTQTIRVLVVDDEYLLRWSVAETLSDAGCKVTQAGDGASALQAISDAPQPFDVTVLDFRLPDTNDLSLLARIRQGSPTTAVVFTTAFGTPDVVSGARALGVYRVVDKPFDMPEIRRLVLAAAHRDHSVH